MTETVNDRLPSGELYGEYDMKFTADISRRMQMPDRLDAIDDVRRLDGFKVDSAMDFGKFSASFGMTMPDRIFLGESDYNFEESKGLIENIYTEDDSMEVYMEQEEPQSNLYETPVKRKTAGLFSAGDLAVPPTPSSMLRDCRMNGGDAPTDWMKIQRHVAKLTCRVERLEEENSRRQQREWLLYPLVVGYCVLQLARLLLLRSK